MNKINVLTPNNSVVTRLSPMKGETLPDAQQVFRVEVVKSILEENNYSLADQRGMRDLIPVILKNEEDNIRSVVEVIFFDGSVKPLLYGSMRN